MRISILLALVAQLITPSQKPGHATIVASPTEVSGKAGTKLVLFVDVTPKPGMHVYAPGNADYIPITVKLNPATEIKPGKVAYPKSEVMTLADEKVSVFQKPFRLTQDVTLEKSATAGSTIAVAGTVQYQACDDRVCYPPESAPVTWAVTVK
ncbi:MAG TPA: protein-disulfide reductase DsbD domain-containing protein [Vicinamibacterales bacterium]|nr:protein-disulfide reductase DsbD domain-containing protein [Vicinamibacterales bacterium]